MAETGGGRPQTAELPTPSEAKLSGCGGDGGRLGGDWEELNGVVGECGGGPVVGRPLGGPPPRPTVGNGIRFNDCSGARIPAISISDGNGGDMYG